jgi:hypothetical protein
MKMNNDIIDIILHIVWGFSLLVAWVYSLAFKKIKFKK